MLREGEAEMVPNIGLVVHYVLDGDPGAGRHAPAIIVNVEGKDTDTLELQVFSGRVPFKPGYLPVERHGAVAHDENAKAPGTWHWPEPEPDRS
jgi:hypothetical protein